MTKIKRLVPLVPTPPVLPQCCVPVKPPYVGQVDWRKRRYKDKDTDPDKCQRSALFKIKGKPYCRVHAGQVALKILLEEDDAGTK